MELYSEAPLPTARGTFRVVVFRDRRNQGEHVAMVMGEVFGQEGLVSLEDLSDRFHRIIIQVIFLDLRRVEAGEGLDLDHVSAVPRSAQVLSTEIAREVDHQRFIP